MNSDDHEIRAYVRHQLVTQEPKGNVILDMDVLRNNEPERDLSGPDLGHMLSVWFLLITACLLFWGSFFAFLSLLQ